MNSRDRVLAALRGQPVDRAPICNPTSVATVALMHLTGTSFPQAHREPELMARLAATSYTELGFDTIMPIFSVVQGLALWAAVSNGDAWMFSLR